MCGSESMLVRSWQKCVLTVVSMRGSITVAAGQSSEIVLYEVPREDSLPGLGIGMTIDEFQIAGICHDCDRVIEECCEVFNRSGSKVL